MKQAPVYLTTALRVYNQARTLIDDFSPALLVHEVGGSLHDPLVVRGLVYPPHLIVNQMLKGFAPTCSAASPDRKAFLLAAGNSKFFGNTTDTLDASTLLGGPHKIPTNLVNQIYAGSMAKRLGFSGYVATDACACASSLKVLQDAQWLINSGGYDEVAVLAIEDQVCHSMLSFFTTVAQCLTARQIAEGRLPSAFDSTQQGFVLGQGAAFAVLASQAAVRKSGATPLAALLATGVASERDATPLAPRPDGEGYGRVIDLALSSAGLTEKSIDLIKTHGTGTPSNNQAEAAAIGARFGRNFVATGYKARIGHTLGVSGLLESIIAIEQARAGKIAEIANRTQEDQNFLSQPYDGRVDTILSLACGMGNIFASAVFRVIR